MNVGAGGRQANEPTGRAGVSAHGRYVVFASRATTLVPHDSNGRRSDVFVRDTRTGRTAIVGLSYRDRQVPGNSANPAISADGRYVAFVSGSRKLVRGDSNGGRDIFVRDLRRGTTVRASVSDSGRQGTRSQNGVPTSADSGFPVISADGRFVAFHSEAKGLVAGDANRHGDAFVHDLRTGSTTRSPLEADEPQSSAGAAPTDISADGRFLVLLAGSEVWVHDRMRDVTTRVSSPLGGGRATGPSGGGRISDDGRTVAFYSDASDLVAGDLNGATDTFVHDQITGATTRLAAGASGQDSTVPADISADGRYVSYSSAPSGETYGAFVHDLTTGRATEVSDPATSDSFAGPFSRDGRYVLFTSRDPNLVARDTNGIPDLFLRGPLR